MESRMALFGCLAATLFMVGVIAFVRVVHYPLFAQVGREEFRAYHAEHVRRTALVVLAPMIVELVLSVVLAASPPEGVSRGLALAGVGAALLTWVVTGGVSVPAHEVLARGYDPSALRTLLRADLARGAAWAIHAWVLLLMVWRAPPP